MNRNEKGSLHDVDENEDKSIQKLIDYYVENKRHVKADDSNHAGYGGLIDDKANSDHMSYDHEGRAKAHTQGTVHSRHSSASGCRRRGFSPNRMRSQQNHYCVRGEREREREGEKERWKERERERERESCTYFRLAVLWIAFVRHRDEEILHMVSGNVGITHNEPELIKGARDFE
jgi:hypothetical protein